MLRVIAVLLLIPLLDVVMLAVVADQLLGWQITVLLVVLTGLLGMLLVRAEGRHTLSEIQRKLASGEIPTDEVIDGGLLIAAGAFFLTPGLVTDALALLLAIPFTRWPVRVAAKKWVITPYIDAKSGGFATGNVYIGGFPGDDDTDRVGFGGMGRPGPDGAGGAGGGENSGFDHDNATDIDFEEKSDE
ncbi:membrane protein FxsA [Halobacteria archaeon HArc-gm2]|nr:membrane protein FxsA [Halobacteria archaeon HArc-gm2]